MVWKTQLLALKALRNTSSTDQHKYEKSVEHRDMKRPEEKQVTKIKPQTRKSPLKLDSGDKLIFEGRGTSSKNELAPYQSAG